MESSALIFGAGSVGRGFLGQLFSESGYAVVFVDIDEPLIAALNARGAYTLRLAGLTGVEDLVVGFPRTAGVRALDARDVEAVAAEVARASLLATAVGARALESIAPLIAAGLTQRWGSGETAPINIILCENLRDAPDVLRRQVRAALPEALRVHLDARVGFVPAVIARMVPIPTPEQRAADPTFIVAEPYRVLPVDRAAFVGEIPPVAGMQPVTPFVAYTDRKLYIHNAAHAILGYLGYRRGYTYGYEALDDPWVRERVVQALAEASRALIAEYGFEPVSFQEHVDYLLLRFANRVLGDPIERLARDPLRKLAPGDRLVGAARLAEKHGIHPDGLALGIAAALTYDHPTDLHAVELQAALARDGLMVTLERVCGIAADEPLASRVREHYNSLLG